ncbi:MAG: N-acetylmuramoyl-L-alanine amidase, partial [Chloroflexota bacterium]
GHVYGYNKGSCGIALIGTYSSVNMTPLSERSLLSLLAWLCYRRGIAPLGSGYFQDKRLPNIMGHRDAMSTSCPGDALYSVLPSIRTRVREQLTGYGQSWVDHKTPARAIPGSVLKVDVTLRNGGTTTWGPGGTNPFRLGYRWYDAAGNLYTAEPYLERHTDIPKSVALGEEVTVNATLLVPTKEGRYTLKWDMVHERVTWFSAKGCETLDVPVIATVVTYGEIWRNHNVPSTMIPGYAASVSIEVENAGVKTWNAKGSNPFRLGYHWYDSQDNLHVQPPGDDRRSSLLSDVAPGQRVSISALAVAPRVPGNYVLKWDMVHEGITWFASEPANATLDIEVRVMALQLPTEPTSLEVAVVDKSRPVFRSILVKNPTQQSLSWNARVVSGDWLDVSSTWGTAPGTVVVTIDPTQLNDGVNEGQLRITGVVGDTQLYVRDIPIKVSVGNGTYSTFLPTIQGS